MSWQRLRDRSQAHVLWGIKIKSHVRTFPSYKFYDPSVVNRQIPPRRSSLNGNCLTKSEHIKVTVIGLITVCHSLLLVSCHFCVNFNEFKRLHL